MKLTQMELIVELGMEHELYKTHELAGMYWWLRQIKFMRVEILEKARASILRSSALSETNMSQKTENISDAKLFATSQLLEAKAAACMAEALSLVSCPNILMKEVLIDNPPVLYYSFLSQINTTPIRAIWRCFFAMGA